LPAIDCEDEEFRGPLEDGEVVIHPEVGILREAVELCEFMAMDDGGMDPDFILEEPRRGLEGLEISSLSDILVRMGVGGSEIGEGHFFSFLFSNSSHQ